MRLESGQTVDGRYRVIERIGSGGMADVWAAEDLQLGRRIALKVLHDNFARDTEFVERFRREAESAAGLQHPNVVGVFDRGDADDTYYIAMELIEGSSLRDLIRRGLSVGEAVEVARQILAAAGYAHQRGIVHRDLKPLNVLIDRSGRVRVTDFGIARAGTSDITRTGSVMGTAQYISPEQAQGHEITSASDIYSIGIVLYEMLTGRVPFDGENPVAIAMKHVSSVPAPPSQLNPEVSPALDAVVLRALAKDPRNRYASAEEMSAALDAAEADPAAAGHTQRFDTLGQPIVLPPGDDRGNWWVALVVAAILIGGLLAFLLTRGEEGTLVPGVLGDSAEEATRALEAEGFEVDEDTIVAKEPEGTVIEQDPLGGTRAPEGSLVTIMVAVVGESKVPDVLGLPQEKAEKRLDAAGFEVQIDERRSDSVRRGRVIATAPGPGTLIANGQTVVISVSTGSSETLVPDVVGLDRLDAQSELQAAGFIVNSEPIDGDEPEGTVIRQNPNGGSELREGEEVTIFYSTGSGTIVIDNYVGQDADFAERELSSRGLDVVIREVTTEDASDDGIVLSQAPPGETRMSPGERVTLEVGLYEAPPDDPDPDDPDPVDPDPVDPDPAEPDPATPRRTR